MSFSTEELFNREFYDYCENHIKEFESNHFWANEVYLFIIQPYLARMLKLKEIRPDAIDISDAAQYPFIADAAASCGIPIKGVKKGYVLFSWIKSIALLIASFGYLFIKMLRIPYHGKMIVKQNNFCIIRTPAAYKKLSLLPDLDIFFEDFKSKTSIYSYFGKLKRMYWVILAGSKSFEVLHLCSKEIMEKVGPASAAYAWGFYGKRMVHTLLYQQMIDAVLRDIGQGKVYYTGNCIDRFAIIEEASAKKCGASMVCIPHGMELGFRLPHCFVGDIFFATSLKAASHLSTLYHTNKFVFDEKIVKTMFQAVSPSGNYRKRLVFLTQQAEFYVNEKIIGGLVPLLKEQGIQLYLKIHPRDKEGNYKAFAEEIEFIQDIEEAICGNICFSRNSTALIEALYNGSSAAAILINNKDLMIYETYPSLQNENINKCYTIMELFSWICQQVKISE